MSAGFNVEELIEMQVSEKRYQKDRRERFH